MLEELQHHYPLDQLQRMSHAAIDALQVRVAYALQAFLTFFLASRTHHPILRSTVVRVAQLSGARLRRCFCRASQPSASHPTRSSRRRRCACCRRVTNYLIRLECSSRARKAYSLPPSGLLTTGAFRHAGRLVRGTPPRCTVHRAAQILIMSAPGMQMSRQTRCLKSLVSSVRLRIAK